MSAPWQGDGKPRRTCLFSMNKSALLLRAGKAVATFKPVHGPAPTSAELADRREKLDKLPPDKANAVADDPEAARRHLPPLKSAWD